MTHWKIENKIAATLLLLLLGISYLFGVTNIALKEGLSLAQIEERYTSTPKMADGLDSFLNERQGAMSLEKLVHLVHTHLMPYAFLYALCAFFALSLGWKSSIKIAYLLTFAGAIVGDIASMFLTRFVDPGFSIVILLSGTLFGLCVASVIFASLYELWIQKEKV